MDFECVLTCRRVWNKCIHTAIRWPAGKNNPVHDLSNFGYILLFICFMNVSWCGFLSTLPNCELCQPWQPRTNLHSSHKNS